MNETKEVFVIIYHEDEDGGFGDAIPTETATLAFDNEAAAKEYCRLNTNKRVYDQPWSDLETGELTYRRLEVRSMATVEDQAKLIDKLMYGSDDNE